jgi:competence protein ComEC
VLVTPEPSVLRAAVMAALVLASMLSGRPVRGIPVLAVASLGLLVSDPWLARSYGFGLSVLATGGLLLMAGPLARMLERWLPRKLALVIAVPLAAQLACQPVIILLNASLPAYGVLANMLAEPAAPIATVLGLAACVALPLAPPLGSVLSQLTWVPSAWIAAVAQFFSGLPGAQLPWPPGALGVLLLFLLTALAVFAMLWRGPRWRWFALGLVLCVLAYAGIVGGSRVGNLLNRPADWEIAGCDVGQGDSFLVRREPALMTKCLRELGISHIDLLVLTHYDIDHVGGTPAVVGMVTRAFVGPGQGAKSDRLVTSLLGGGAQVQQVSRGPTGVLGDLRWSVLWPPLHLNGIELGNPASVTVEFTPIAACACLSSIFLGDLGEDAQNRVLAANPSLGHVDVVKVGHHGSADQSSKLYERLQATVGLIGVGVDNGYGHPTQKLLDILARVGTVPERTDQHGLLLVSAGATRGSVNVWTEK